MTISGLKRLGPASEETIESSWVIPSDVTAGHLKDTLHYINLAEFSPPTFEEGVLAEHQLKRKTVTRRKAAYDDDEDGEADDGIDDDLLFPAGGPPTRKVIDEPDKPKKIRRRRKRKDDEEGELDLAALDEKARKRRDREREKARKIKSALYVNEGDDEFDSDEDEAFFAREREIRTRAEQAAKSAVFGNTDAVKAPARKRKSELISDDSDEDDDEDEDDLSFARKVLSSPENADSDGTDDTPIDNSDGERKKQKKKRRVSAEDEEDDSHSDATEDASDVEMTEPGKAVPSINDEGVAEDEDGPVAPTRRSRIRGGFVLDSDDDDD
jgi:replication fork protection complex subunit Tof1/Swi1